MSNPRGRAVIHHPVEAEVVFRAVLGSARKPSDSSLGIDVRSFEELGWGRICEEIANRCASDDAAELARFLGPLEWGPVPKRRRDEVMELVQLLQTDDSPPVRGVKSIGRALMRVRKGDVLQGPDLLAIADTIVTAERIREYFRSRAARTSLMTQHVSRLVSCRPVAAEIHRSFDPSGEVADTASMELARLRRRVASLRDQIRDRLDRILRSPKYDGILQDEYITIRDERYVVPVRAGEKGDFPGIVHGQSSSGQTLFIEPQELVGLNNEFRVAQMDVENEIRRILQALTTQVGRHVDALDDNQDILTYLDLSLASATLAGDLRCESPELTGPRERGALQLRRARHPLLALREFAGEMVVVENDITLADNAHVLVISGPNTGGKTVTLKLLGLFTIMTRAGLPVTCDKDSRLPLFESLFSDIGDDQNVERDLSTFSAHVRNIARVLPDCDGTSLLLLDELFAGTDPEQGAALGRALLDELARRGTWCVVTTHLERLKTLAFEDERYACASVGFDVARLEPTYSLRMGVPGASYALRIAARLGLSARICEKAEAMLGDAPSAEREQLLDRLQIEHQHLVEERKEVSAMRLELSRAVKDAEAKRALLERKDREALESELRNLREETQKLRDSIRKQAQTLREGAGSTDAGKALEESRRLVQQAEEKHAAAQTRVQQSKSARTEQQREPATWSALKVGTAVWVQPFRRVGEVADTPRVGERISVRLGSMRATFALDDLFLHTADVAKGDAGFARAAGPAARVAPSGDVSTVLDVRGATVEDAIEQLDAFIDRAVRARLFQVSVVHGHGTGALKRAVRGQLAASPHGVEYRPGERGEGGDGVTIVYMEPRPSVQAGA
jgi:DNA mismatch repair protein MutS2